MVVLRMPKLTFSLDEATVDVLRQTAQRHRKPQSLIVREAIAQYAAREEKLTGEERERLLGILRRIKSRPQTRSDGAVDAELQDLRRRRRTGWSRRSR
jgi:hypothetical protein